MKIHYILFFAFMLINGSLSAQVNPEYHYVKGYYRSDGVYIKSHYKTNSNQTNRDNYSTKPNKNPWTGESGYIEPDLYYYQTYFPDNKSEFLSKTYNRAKELNEQKQYEESIRFCKEAIGSFNRPILSAYLLGWNYLSLKKYDLALETFKNYYKNITQSHFAASTLYLSYLLNNNVSVANELKDDFSKDTTLFLNFRNSLTDDLRRLNLNQGIPNERILELILDNELLYLDQGLLRTTYSCSECKIEYISKNILHLGEGLLKKRFIFKNGIEGPCIAVEMECPRIFRNSIITMLKEINFTYKGTFPVPILRKKGDQRPNLTEGEMFIRKKDSQYSGIVIYDLDLEGEENSEYFTIVIRK